MTIKTKEQKLIKIDRNRYALVLPKKFVDRGKEVLLEFDNHHLCVRHKISPQDIAREQLLIEKYATAGLRDLSVKRKNYLKKYLSDKYPRD